MKQGIHPDYHEITIVMTDGTKYKTRSTYGKEGDTLQLDVDPKTHPAWVGGVNLRKTGQLEKFNNKFSAFGNLGAKNAKSGKSEAQPQAKKADKAEKPVKEAKKKEEPKAEATETAVEENKTE